MGVAPWETDSHGGVQDALRLGIARHPNRTTSREHPCKPRTNAAHQVLRGTGQHSAAKADAVSAIVAGGLARTNVVLSLRSSKRQRPELVAGAYESAISKPTASYNPFGLPFRHAIMMFASEMSSVLLRHNASHGADSNLAAQLRSTTAPATRSANTSKVFDRDGASG